MNLKHPSKMTDAELQREHARAVRFERKYARRMDPLREDMIVAEARARRMTLLVPSGR